MKNYGMDMNFLNSYKRTANNSLQFENISISYPASENHESKYGVKIWDIDLITTYLPSLIENSDEVTVNKEDSTKFSMNPWLFSKHHLGSTVYWYIILAMNSYKSSFDFKNFNRPLLIPKPAHLTKLVTELERDGLLRDKNHSGE